jgi:DNA repair photolyase
VTFDQYNNCGYSCVYCFSAYQRATKAASAADYVRKVVRPVDIHAVKRIFTQPESSSFGEYVRRRMPIQWGGLSDPFCAFERRYGVGLKLLRFFRDIDYPICFSTKGTWWLRDPRYRDLFTGAKNWNVKVSIVTLDASAAAALERGVPTPHERLVAIEQIAAFQGGGATLRLRPFLVGITDPHHVDLIRQAGARGATALSTEFFCLERRSPVLRRLMPILDQLAHRDYLAFYKTYSSGSGYLRLNRNLKRPFINEMEEAARAAGMRFYVSDAHFKERCDNGSCCGLPPSWDYSRGSFCEALVLCRQRGSVRWSDIDPNTAHLAAVRWDRAPGYNTSNTNRAAQFRGFSLRDYLRWLWNNPTAGQSPYVMSEGVMRPAALDEHGDVVYEFDTARA